VRKISGEGGAPKNSVGKKIGSRERSKRRGGRRRNRGPKKTSSRTWTKSIEEKEKDREVREGGCHFRRTRRNKKVRGGGRAKGRIKREGVGR